MGSVRNKSIISLSIGALLFAYTFYLYQLFGIGDAYMAWLIALVLVNSVLLYANVKSITFPFSHTITGALLLLDGFVIGYGTWLLSDPAHALVLILKIASYLLLLFIVIAIYQIALLDGPTAAKLTKKSRVLHAFTITIGLVLIVGTLYCLNLYYLHSVDSNNLIWLLLIPLVMYLVTYTVQVNAINRQQNTLFYSLTIVQIIIPGILLWLWVNLSKWGGVA